MSNMYVTEGLAEYVLTLFDDSFIGVCVDIGAYDPFWTSNSWIFEKKGWRTYCIEPNPSRIPILKENRSNVLQYACGAENKDNMDLIVYVASESVGEAAGTGLQRFPDSYHESIFSHTEKVSMRTLDWLMKNKINESTIDYLSIDVERYEMEVLKGITLDLWKPKVLVTEDFNENKTQYNYLTEKNYILVHRINVNDIYIRKEYYDNDLPIKEDS